jgi:Ca2+:H+ antiporter
LVRSSVLWAILLAGGAFWLEHAAPERHVLIFLAACGAIVPLAGWLGRSTEQLADRAGAGLGGFLNATLGNAAELIIAVIALRQGQIDIVKASIAGSIIGNILLVLGAAFLLGGLRYPVQRFDPLGGRNAVSTLLVSSVALVIVGVYNALGRTSERAADVSSIVNDLSLAIAVILLFVYALNLWFSLGTHRAYFEGERSSDAGAAQGDHHEAPWSPGQIFAVMGAATIGIAWMSEIMVGSVTEAASALGMSKVFVGVIVVALVGNAAEHSTAVIVARKDRMDLAFGIAVGSSIQIALFVAPLLVLLSYVIAPQPMNLAFSSGEGLAVILAITTVSHLLGDGRSTWFEGALLLAVYLILALAFYFLP